MAPTELSAHAPLLPPAGEQAAGEGLASNGAAPSGDRRGLHFYDPAAVLQVSREVAFGYLILLTGGSVQYDPPALASHYQAADPPAPVYPDGESAALAYAAIVDGNLLHACFGLEATASGGVTIADGNESLSIFCCIPAPSASATRLLAAKKMRLQGLVELLREVRDAQYEDLARGTADTLCMKIIRAYIRCFTAIVAYHDANQNATAEAIEEADGMCCSKMVRRLGDLLMGSKVDPQLVKIRHEALRDIANGFWGLREDIRRGLGKTAAAR